VQILGWFKAEAAAPRCGIARAPRGSPEYSLGRNFNATYGQARILGGVDRSHAAFAKFFQDSIARVVRADADTIARRLSAPGWTQR